MAMIANKIPPLKVNASSSNEIIRVLARRTSKKTFPETNEDDRGLKDNSSSSTPRSISSIASVMVTNATTLEEQIACLMRAIEDLAKHIQEQDSQISKMMNTIDNSDASHVAKTQVQRHEEEETSLNQQSSEIE
ncbi:UNVERIFIED_CONTAM: hypothetical protein Sindi_0991100, partial [Sesamum indicum]